MYRRTSRTLGGGGGKAHKMSGIEGGERIGVNYVNGEGGFYHLALILEGESKFEPSALSLKRIFWGFNGVGVVKEG